MDYIGKHFTRKVYWLNYNRASVEELPAKDWVCLATANSEPDRETFEKFVRISLDSGIAEFKGHGLFAEKLHDILDEIIIAKKLEKGESINNLDDFLNSLITTWHNDETLADAFWQCFFATCLTETTDYDNVSIVCTDLDNVDRKNELADYLERFRKGWLPDESSE